jgi:hypothetical protein
MDLDRLRDLAREPERTAMPKGPLPSMTDQVFALKQENAALRRGLNEAIEEIETLWERIANAREILEGSPR